MFGLGVLEIGVIFGVASCMLIPGLIGSNLAIVKGRARPLWFFACAVMPIFTILLLFLPPVSVARGLVKQCPSCHGFISRNAGSCKHCGRELARPVVLK